MEGLANYYGMNKLDPVRKRVRLQELVTQIGADPISYAPIGGGLSLS